MPRTFLYHRLRTMTAAVQTAKHLAGIEPAFTPWQGIVIAIILQVQTPLPTGIAGTDLSSDLPLLPVEWLSGRAVPLPPNGQPLGWDPFTDLYAPTRNRTSTIGFEDRYTVRYAMRATLAGTAGLEPATIRVTAGRSAY
jgi:hypothetical protein